MEGELAGMVRTRTRIRIRINIIIRITMTITRMITITVHLFEPVRPSKSGSIGKFIPASPLANDIENEIDNDNCNSWPSPQV